MGTGKTATVTLSGGGPWGFRLIGGEGFPLQVAKIRKRSKSHDAGLQEGDTLVNINGISMAGKSHQDAMYQVDNSGGTLVIDVLRDGTSAPPAMTESQHMTNGYHQVDTAPSVASTVSTRSFRDGPVTTNVVTEQYASSGDGRVTKGFVKQVVKQRKTQGQPVYQQSTVSQHTQSSSQRTYSPQPPHQSSHIETTYSQQPSYKLQNQTYYEVPNEMSFTQQLSPRHVGSTESQYASSHPMFKVKNVKHSLKENYSPVTVNVAPTTSYTESPMSSPVFRVRDIKGTLQTQVESQLFSPAPDTPEMQTQSSPRQQPTGLIPPPPPPPVPQHFSKSVPPAVAPKPLRSASVPVDYEPELYPVPKPPFVRFDARQIPHHHYVKNNDDEDEVDVSFENANDEDKYHGKLPIFAPKVEISLEERQALEERIPPHLRQKPDLIPLDLTRTMSLESEMTDPGSPDTQSTGFKKKKKMYSDSAFYDDPSAEYPTIEQQIGLCKKIARSLTSAANRRARGAKMFAKRRRRSNKWIHDGSSHHGSSSTGDIADLRDLESELSVDDGGTRNLFTFRIPNLRFQVTSPEDGIHKMSISQNEFEQLRLQKSKCDHHVVSPETCHSLVADLKSPRNKGAKLFQKRQARSEKWVIDESNAVKPMMKPDEINRFLAQTSPQPKALSPWDAALQNEGRINTVFQQQNVRNSNANVTNYPETAVHHDLSGEMHVKTVTGPNYNRTPRGWGSQSVHAGSRGSSHHHHRSSHKQEQPPPPPPKPFKQAPYTNYNKKIQAWDPSMGAGPAPHPAVQAERSMGPRGYTVPQQHGYQTTNSYNGHFSSQQMIPATDL